MHLRTLQSHRIHAYTTPGASSRRPCPLHRIIKNTHIHHPSSSSRTLFPFYAFTRNFQSTSFAYSIHIIHSQQLTRSSHSSTSFAHVAWHHVFYDPLTTTKTLFHLVRELKLKSSDATIISGHTLPFMFTSSTVVSRRPSSSSPSVITVVISCRPHNTPHQSVRSPRCN